MSQTWLDRLQTAVERDGRSLTAISRAAGLGQNYLQQLFKDRKEPGIEKMIRLLNALGSASILYVIGGIEVGPEDEVFLSAVLELQPDQKRKAAAFFETLPAPAHRPGLPPSSAPADGATDRKG